MSNDQNPVINKSLVVAMHRVRSSAFKEMLRALLSHPKTVQFLSDKPWSSGYSVTNLMIDRCVNRQSMARADDKDLEFFLGWLEGLTEVFPDHEIFEVVYVGFQMLIHEQPNAAFTVAHLMGWPLNRWK